MVAAGCVRTNNVMNTLLKNLLDACGAALGFYSVGYAFAWGGSFHDQNTTDITFIGWVIVLVAHSFSTVIFVSRVTCHIILQQRELLHGRP